uniref:Uncharacterized protein n=1 Tax=Arundo donax TaxID=35708 RepID=A0A0A9CCY7_ARUDO
MDLSWRKGTQQCVEYTWMQSSIGAGRLLLVILNHAIHSALLNVTYQRCSGQYIASMLIHSEKQLSCHIGTYSHWQGMFTKVLVL